MNKVIKVYAKESFGVVYFYPISANVLRIVQAMCKTKTITDNVIKHLKSVGYTFELIPNPTYAEYLAKLTA
jgi:hypothetical protein